MLAPVQRPVHHPYTDLPSAGIRVLCYPFEEVFAEKMRALAERQRPRDLYDVVHLYRRQDLQPDRAVVRSTLARKCEFKGIPVPTFDAPSSWPSVTGGPGSVPGPINRGGRRAPSPLTQAFPREGSLPEGRDLRAWSASADRARP